MSLLPPPPLAPPGNRGCNPRLLAAGLVLLALAALGLLLPTAHGLIKRNLPPPDMPWTGHGLSDLYIAPDGTWTITRRQYLDRNQRLVITPGGSLQEFRDSGQYRGIDVSGGFSLSAPKTRKQTGVAVQPAPPYHSWRKSLRSPRGNAYYLNQLPTALPEKSVVLAHPYIPHQDFQARPDKAVKAFDGVPTSVIVRLNPLDKLWVAEILPGHWFYDVFDAAAFVDPYLWLTTDRQRLLHRVRIDEPFDQPPELSVEQSVSLNLDSIAQRNCRLGIDPLRKQLFLVRADGSRFWFDPQTLAPTGRDQLPGNWAQEYAQFNPMPGAYSQWFGTPLARRTYDRIMETAMVVFLASLLGLSLLWRPQWKSTSAPTTADSSSSADSEST